MERYFMTIPEAAHLLLQAASLGNKGEIFLLDMGEPVRVLDLAKDMIRLSGLTPGEDIEIEFTGQRPGEKIKEELLIHQDGAKPTVAEKIFVAPECDYDFDQFESWIHKLIDAAENEEDGRIIEIFQKMGIEYQGHLHVSKES
jgi:FlaA1/EpsC-like NDP-sugar epimerase